MTREERRQMAYLVRLVRADSEGPPLWRIAVEDVHSGEKRGFVNLEALCRFLSEQMEADAAGAAADERPAPATT